MKKAISYILQSLSCPNPMITVPVSEAKNIWAKQLAFSSPINSILLLIMLRFNHSFSLFMFLLLSFVYTLFVSFLSFFFFFFFFALRTLGCCSHQSIPLGPRLYCTTHTCLLHLHNDRHAWTNQNSLMGIGRQ